MSRFLLLLFPVIMIMPAGCAKPEPEYNDAVTGRWKLAIAEQLVANDFVTITTGYETGIFSFYENSEAVYTEAGTEMRGSWNYYCPPYNDQDQNQHYQYYLRLRLLGFRPNRALDLSFDQTYFENSGNSLYCYILAGSTKYRYVFERQ